MRKVLKYRDACWLVLLAGASVAPAWATEHVTLTNGFEMVCDHRVTVGDRVRLYLTPGSNGFVEFGVAEVASVDAGPPSAKAAPLAAPLEPVLTEAELHEMLAKAGAQHNLDVDLLASLIHAESGGNVHAVSRTGARGLMQLMPRTAKELGVADSFHAQENINGGTAYLDSLLVKYHDKLALALAAYNAGPAAVDRWHGVPPYRETRAYVARVIREFNRAALARKRDTKLAAQQAAKLTTNAAKAATQLAFADHPHSATIQSH